MADPTLLGLDEEEEEEDEPIPVSGAHHVLYRGRGNDDTIA